MDGEIASDEPEMTPIAQWKHETFHVGTSFRQRNQGGQGKKTLIQTLTYLTVKSK